MSDRLNTLSDTASQIGRTANSLKWLVRTGRGPESVFIDGRRLFRQSAIDAYIESAPAKGPTDATGFTRTSS